ncbi:inositol-pentakisphosphate 2-kinase-domain-containing protein [Zopfochytrium polystomum]|nr:inositol-pentakisphosphate 2-kinase-domain-containing protein [Zopfochytrium polystomum]
MMILPPLSSGAAPPPQPPPPARPTAPSSAPQENHVESDPLPNLLLPAERLSDDPFHEEGEVGGGDAEPLQQLSVSFSLPTSSVHDSDSSGSSSLPFLLDDSEAGLEDDGSASAAADENEGGDGRSSLQRLEDLCAGAFPGSLDPESYTYASTHDHAFRLKGEGNRHIVLSILPTQSAPGGLELSALHGKCPLAGCVLRLRKRRVQSPPHERNPMSLSPAPTPSVSPAPASSSSQDPSKKLRRMSSIMSYRMRDIPPLDSEFHFHTVVVQKLLGREYLGKMEKVQVDSEFIASVATLIETDRLAERRMKTEVDPTQSVSVLCSDHTVFSESGNTPESVAIEIKPKWGFLPQAHVIASKSAPKLRTCRYCMYKFVKASKHSDKDLPSTKYCPLDLYSGDEDRMFKALKALAETPLNNMKVFIDGVRAVHDKSIDAKFLASILFGERPHSSREQDDDYLWKLLVKILKREPILEKLRHHQRRLDRYDIETIHQWYGSLSSETEVLRPLVPREWEEVLSSYLRSESSRGNIESVGQPEHVTTADKIRGIYEFLVSSSLKDCSIIVTVRRRNEPISTGENNSAAIVYGESQYEYKIHVVDVDLKPLDKIPSYFEKDRKIAG